VNIGKTETAIPYGKMRVLGPDLCQLRTNLGFEDTVSVVIYAMGSFEPIDTVVNVIATVCTYPTGVTTARIGVYSVIARAVDTRIGCAVVDVLITFCTSPTDVTATRIRVYAVTARAIHARVGIAVIDIHIAFCAGPTGVTTARIGVYAINTSAVDTRIRIAVIDIQITV